MNYAFGVPNFELMVEQIILFKPKEREIKDAGRIFGVANYNFR